MRVCMGARWPYQPLAACLIYVLMSCSTASMNRGSPADQPMTGQRRQNPNVPAQSSMPAATFTLDDQNSPAENDPVVVDEGFKKLLSETQGGITVHFMPQVVDDPDCHVVTFEPKRHGGRCSRMAGGMPFCAVKNYVFPNHPDCVDSEAGSSSERPWTPPDWFAHMGPPNMETTTSDLEEATFADTGPTPEPAAVEADDIQSKADDTQPEIRPTENVPPQRRRGHRGRGRRRQVPGPEAANGDDKR